MAKAVAPIVQLSYNSFNNICSQLYIQGGISMKKQSIFCSILAASVLASAPVLAAGNAVTSSIKEAEAAAETSVDAIAETAGEIISEDAAPALITPQTDEICGEWFNAGYIGEYKLTLAPIFKFYVLPDGNFGIPGEMYTYESLGDNTFKADLPADYAAYADAITIELGTVQEGDMEKYGFSEDSSYLTAVGSPKLTVTITVTDTSNPLATNAGNLVGETVFLKDPTYSDLANVFMLNKSFNIGSNLLAIDSEGNLDLNSGANTGKISFNYDEQYAAVVTFRWDTNANIKYYISSISANEIVLVNMEDEADVLTLTVADTPTAAAAAEEAPAN